VGVIVEMAYKSRKTKLLQVAESFGNDRWIGVDGVQVIIEQGVWQFEKWTGCRAPREAIEQKVAEKYNA